MPKEQVTMNLRLPPDLHAAIKAAADRDGRSMNNLIVHLLRQVVPPLPPPPPPKPE